MITLLLIEHNNGYKDILSRKKASIPLREMKAVKFGKI
jgi:hypothetical protein